MTKEITSGGVPGVLPGLNVMIGHSIINLIKSDLLSYVADYLNSGY